MEMNLILGYYYDYHDLSHIFNWNEGIFVISPHQHSTVALYWMLKAQVETDLIEAGTGALAKPMRNRPR